MLWGARARLMNRSMKKENLIISLGTTSKYKMFMFGILIEPLIRLGRQGFNLLKYNLDIRNTL